MKVMVKQASKSLRNILRISPGQGFVKAPGLFRVAGNLDNLCSILYFERSIIEASRFLCLLENFIKRC